MTFERVQLSLQEFAADLFDVVNKTGKRPIYEDPGKFFSLSYATRAKGYRSCDGRALAGQE